VTRHSHDFGGTPRNPLFWPYECAWLVHKTLYLQFLLSDARRLVPMGLRLPYRTIGELHFRIPLAFTPPSGAVKLPQTGQFTNGVADRERFDPGNLTADLEEHSAGILSFLGNRPVRRPFRTAAAAPIASSGGRRLAGRGPGRSARARSVRQEFLTGFRADSRDAQQEKRLTRSV